MGTTTAIFGVPFHEGLKGTHTHNRSLYWVLLYSGSGGNLLFKKTGSVESVLHYTLAVRQVWHTSNWIFQTEN